MIPADRRFGRVAVRRRVGECEPFRLFGRRHIGSLTLLAIVALAACDRTAVTETEAIKAAYTVFWDCPQVFGSVDIYNCRPLTGPESSKLSAQFDDPDRYRTNVTECAEIRDGLQRLLNAGQVYWAHPEEALGYSWHFPTVGIVLDGALFFEFDGQDPWKNLRLKVATHEAAHEYNLPDDPPGYHS
jgi:hypothetical protein